MGDKGSKRARPTGVSDGTRTRDICDHNAALYQLSYTHRGSLAGALEESTMPSTRL